ncbi:hypothetical protein FRC10_001434 [Ceratobasidium sp. 414]|nr:hypothetical protein FRC10_001434 [Ceratobasidium sp. 414]
MLDFLHALFAKKHHKTVLGARSVTGEAGVLTLEQASAESFVSFSHFALAKDSETLASPSLAGALVRGMALQAKDNQVSIDAVIPVHMGSLTMPISPATTSAINLQFKNHQLQDLEKPVLSIIFQFGANPPEGTSHVHVQELPHPTMRQGEGRTHYDDHHYEIIVYGRHAEAFNAIPSAAGSHYDAILGQGGFEDNFARQQHQANLAAMWNLKPAFSGKGKEYDEWFETGVADHADVQVGSSH